MIKFVENSHDAGKGSMWVRMLQPHGGIVESFHLPLRKGTEVMLTFEGGDPDRPVIAGVLPNPETPSPVTKTNKTLNVIETGGHNRIEMEDQDGSQYIRLSTPTEQSFLQLGKPDEGYNVNLGTAGKGHLHTGNNFDVNVDGDHKVDVKGAVAETYHKSQKTTVTNQQTVTVQGNQTVHTTGQRDLTVDKDQKITVGGGRTDKVQGGNVDETYDHGQTTHVKGNRKLDVTGKETIEANDIEIHAKGGKVELINGSWFTTAMDAKGSATFGAEMEFYAAAKLEVCADIKLGICIGVDTDIHAGADINLHFATYMAICIGLDLGLCLGAAIDVCLGPSIDIKGVVLAEAGINIFKADLSLEEGELKLETKTIGIGEKELTVEI